MGDVDESLLSLSRFMETSDEDNMGKDVKDIPHYLPFETIDELLPSEECSVKAEPAVKQFNCNCCSLSFDDENSLLKHEEVHFEVEEINECLNCSNIFATKSELQNHVCRRRSIQLTSRYRCKECGKSFLQNSGLRAHLSIHTGEKPYGCEFCTSSFRLSSSLYRHKLREHIGIKPYTCEHCEKQFGHQSDLKHHVRSVHAPERLFNCEICGEKFTSNVVLMRHVNIHFELKLYVCKICNAKFSHSGTLYNHMRVHSTERKFSCNNCGKSYKFKAHLKNHNCTLQSILAQVSESKRRKSSETKKL